MINLAHLLLETATLILLFQEKNISIFIEGLTILEIAIEAVSWWCNATDNNKKENGCPHGYGGPITKYGWFTEMCHDFDEIEKEVLAGLDNNCNHKLIKDINDKVKQIIENKQTVKNAEGLSLKYNSNSCLTPALWLYVADDWVR